jgi:hypothetical protein
VDRCAGSSLYSLGGAALAGLKRERCTVSDHIVVLLMLIVLDVTSDTFTDIYISVDAGDLTYTCLIIGIVS